MSLSLAILALIGVSPTPSLQQDNSWVELRFHRVYLRNGAWIEGDMVSQTDKEVTLRVKYGDMSIRLESIDHVELVKMRSFAEKPPAIAMVPKPPPVGVRPVRPEPGPRATPGTLPPFEAAPETKQKIDALLLELAHANPEGKMSVMDRLADVGGDAGPYLASLMDKIDRADLSVVTAAVVKCKDLRAIPILIRLSESTDALLRTAAASGLGGMADDRAVEPLISLLKDNDPTVKATALGSLHEMNSDRAFTAALELIGSPDRQIRTQAIQVAQDLSAKLNLRRDYIEGVARSIESASAAAKFDLLGALGRSGEKEKWGVIIPYLRDDEAQVRAAAAMALGRLSAQEAAAALSAQAAAEADGRVKLQIATAARQISAKGAIDSLIRWLREPNEEIKTEAHISLKSLTGKDFGTDAERWTAWWEENRPK